MSKFFVTIALLLFAFNSMASHIYGGEMIYDFIGNGTSGNTKKYRITLRLFRDDLGGGAALPTSVIIGVFDYGTKKHVPSTSTGYTVSRNSGPSPVPYNVSPCVSGSVNVSYSLATYTLEVELPNNAEGYICSYETCCRVNNLVNVYHPGGGPGGAGGTGSTYVCKIPGTNQLPATEHNSSPQFVTALDLVCFEKAFQWNFSATDVDGDKLVYSFYSGYNKTTAPDANPIPPAAPAVSGSDYPLLEYINGYSSSRPLGAAASLNNNTGIISGIAPPQGLYVVAVLVKEYRNNKLIGEHIKDFILNVRNCDFSGARLEPEYSACNGFDYTFQNLNTSPLNKTFYWDFGVKDRDDDFSTEAMPTFTFPDTGLYKVKLVINRNNGCSDSTTTDVSVFPGFYPGFTTSGICINKPTQFKDTTYTKYGYVNSWKWNFGDRDTNADTSRSEQPQYTYPAINTYNVSLIVTSSKGCKDTLQKDISIIDKPPVSVAFKDTLICNGDNLQLTAMGNGSFSWSPGNNVTNANTAKPTVRPNTTTNYVVELNDNGCINRDTVQVRVVNTVTLNTGKDTTICLTDGVQLNAFTDGLRYEWQPAATLNNPNLLTPIAKPTQTTTYQITSYIGNCSAKGNITVTTIPYPGAFAGNDVTVCYSEGVQLNASHNGSSFFWSPAATLTNANTLTPTARPLTTTAYILTVTDNVGCPKPGRDTVVVNVLPKIRAFAGNDTAVVIGQSLQLQASGGLVYQWLPATGLNKTNISNPVGIYDGSRDSIRYKVYVRNENSCTDSAYVTVKIFKSNPQIYVPNAFTPNGDRMNSTFRPIPVGMSRIEYFRVYNRWGQIVYSSTNGKGWDGKIGGIDQPTGSYVWMVKGVDYLGKDFVAKGTVTLIR